MTTEYKPEAIRRNAAREDTYCTFEHLFSPVRTALVGADLLAPKAAPIVGPAMTD
jgi:hypothetical protein